jgi:hypothetical protein
MSIREVVEHTRRILLTYKVNFPLPTKFSRYVCVRNWIYNHTLKMTKTLIIWKHIFRKLSYRQTNERIYARVTVSSTISNIFIDSPTYIAILLWMNNEILQLSFCEKEKLFIYAFLKKIIYLDIFCCVWFKYY